MSDEAFGFKGLKAARALGLYPLLKHVKGAGVVPEIKTDSRWEGTRKDRRGWVRHIKNGFELAKRILRGVESHFQNEVVFTIYSFNPAVIHDLTITRIVPRRQQLTHRGLCPARLGYTVDLRVPGSDAPDTQHHHRKA